MGLRSSLAWSGSEGTDAIAPDHRGVTITHPVTVVLPVGLARFAGSPPPGALPAQPGDDDDTAGYRPVGFWKSIGFVLGVPVLLFLDVSSFLLAPSTNVTGGPTRC